MLYLVPVVIFVFYAYNLYKHSVSHLSGVPWRLIFSRYPLSIPEWKGSAPWFSQSIWFGKFLPDLAYVGEIANKTWCCLSARGLSGRWNAGSGLQLNDLLTNHESIHSDTFTLGAWSKTIYSFYMTLCSSWLLCIFSLSLQYLPALHNWKC